MQRNRRRRRPPAHLRADASQAVEQSTPTGPAPRRTTDEGLNHRCATGEGPAMDHPSGATGHTIPSNNANVRTGHDEEGDVVMVTDAEEELPESLDERRTPDEIFKSLKHLEMVLGENDPDTVRMRQRWRKARILRQQRMPPETQLQNAAIKVKEAQTAVTQAERDVELKEIRLQDAKEGLRIANGLLADRKADLVSAQEAHAKCVEMLPRRNSLPADINSLYQAIGIQLPESASPEVSALLQEVQVALQN